MTEQLRNKYNTLTPAEARKLNRVLSSSRQPLRTASVLRKPRAPPIVVTNLDNEVERQLLADGQTVNSHWCNSLSRQNSVRGSSLGPAGDCRHTVQPGQLQGALASRLSLFSTASTKSASANPNNNKYTTTTNHCQQNQQSHQLPGQISPHESFSNLSFRSSRDVPDCGAYDPTYRFQTMSVDLGQPNNSQARSSANRAYDTMQSRVKYVPQRSHTLNYRFSDDSFASAKSDLSAKSSSVTPTKFNPQTTSTTQEPLRSASKASLSSSTYKLLQSPFVNFKKLFRGAQKEEPPRKGTAPTSKRDLEIASLDVARPQNARRQPQQQLDTSLSVTDFSLSDTISNLSLNKSQSPPVFPPPPGELKSMSYLENSIAYSNYDEFTRSRNERMARPSPVSLGENGPVAAQPATSNIQPIVPTACANSSTFNTPMNFQQAQRQTLDSVASEETDNSSWQMTSLPVCYERNLTTVFEEKQASCEMSGAPKAQISYQDDRATEEVYQRIKPPTRFDDPNCQQQQLNIHNHHQLVASELSESCERPPSVASSHSPALSSAAESVLEFHRQQPATPYRFSFAQPLADSNQASLCKSLGLPPRVPAGAQHSTGSNNSESGRRHDNSSSGNSSNCSSQINGINHCDKRNLTDLSRSGALGATEAVAVSEALDKLSYSISDSGGYGTAGGQVHDADTTILSDTSTLQGESGPTYYANKCAELERTVVSLKDKLIMKEKELTDAQLSLMNKDFTIEQLRKQVSKLERENAQLKTMVVTRGGSGATAANATTAAISRIHV